MSFISSFPLYQTNTHCMQRVEITKYTNEAWQRVSDLVAIEEPLNISLSVQGLERSIAITMRTPGSDADLAYGFLFTEGIIQTTTGSEVITKQQSASQLAQGNEITIKLPAHQAVDWQKLSRHSYTSSSCGVCGKTAIEQVFQAIPFGEMPTNWRCSPTILQRLPDQLRERQSLFKATGGIHAAGLFTLDGDLITLAEDIGRHNALDKLIGYQLQQDNLPLTDHLLVLSGRASFELIQKAAMAGIRLVLSVGAPSSLACSLAEEQGITLCGFTKSNSFNCYCHPARIFETTLGS